VGRVVRGSDPRDVGAGNPAPGAVQRCSGLDRPVSRQRTWLAQGYEFATVSELLAAGEPVMSATCYDSRPGDADRWPFRHPAPLAAAPSGLAWPWQSAVHRR